MGIVQQGAEDLFQRRIGDDARVTRRRVLQHHGDGVVRLLAPLRHDLGQEAAQGGDGRRLAARLARRHQDAGHDGLAALDLGLHFGDVGGQVGIGLEFWHPLPVAEDDRQRGQGRAQLMGGAGRQQPHAHDVVLFRRLLPGVRQIGVASTHVLGRARDKGDQQHGDQDEVDQGPGLDQPHVGVGVRRQQQRLMPDRQPGQTGAGDQNKAPGVGRPQQHRRQHDLHQIEGREGIAGPAAEEQQPGQGRYIDEQGQDQLRIGHAVTTQGDRGAGQVHHRQPGRGQQQHAQRQRDLQPPVDHGDGHHLPDHRQPSQLDQQQHVAPPGCTRRYGRLGPVVQAQQAACETHRAHCAALRRFSSRQNSTKPAADIKARPNQVRA
ncbi:hypothetical protein D3C80_955550 [compost metagenome]